MATYKGIKGVKVQTKATDPTASEAEGTVWYNSTGGALKYAIQGAGAWAAGADINTGKLNCVGFGVSQNAALKTVGEGGSPSGVTNKTELYNGTSWTEVADGSQSVQSGAGFGTTAAGINVSGDPPNVVTQTWDGTSWSDVNNCNTQVSQAAGLGISTAGMKAGGGSSINASETWDGTSWTEGANINQARYQCMGAGTTVAGVIGGGAQPPNTNYALTEEWNGSSWSEVNNMNTGRAGFGCATSGTQTDWLAFGGGPDTPAYTAKTESYDGTSWTELASLATAMANGTSAGVSNSALSATGRGPGNIPFGVGTEEWSDPVYVVKTVTVS